MLNVKSPIHKSRTNPGRLNKNPGRFAAPILLADAADVEELLVTELVLESGRCGTEAEAIPVRVFAPLVPVVVVLVNVPVVEIVEVVIVVVLLGVVVEVVEVVDVVPIWPVVSRDIVPVDGRGGRSETSKWLVVV
jgi:hypothetical protein